MTNDADQLLERFDPYVRVPGASHRLDFSETRSEMVRELLVSRAVEQAQSIIEAVDRADTHRLPLVLVGLDRETKGLLTRRILAMLAAYRRFLTERSHADVQRQLDIVFRPIGTWIGGQYAITSPALLVVQSILYSHCEWFHESGWEANSAVRAHRELRGTGSNQRAIVSESHARFIAGIIAHQTLLRASWTTGEDDKAEVFASRRKGWVPDDDREAVGLGVARTLFPFLGEEQSGEGRPTNPARPDRPGGADLETTVRQRQLAAALVLHSMCLFCRHYRTEPGSIAVMKGQAMDALDAMLAPPRTDRVAVLAYMQYGRYVYASQGNDSKLMESAKKYILQKHILPHTGGANVMFAFQRVPSKNVWRKEEFDEVRVDPRTDWHLNETTGDEIRDLVAPTVGREFRYKAGNDGYINALLGTDALTGFDEMGEDVTEALARMLKAAANRHLGYIGEPSDYFPAPLIGHVIRALHDRRSLDFTPLHIVARDIRRAAATANQEAQFTIWLPNLKAEAAIPANGVWTKLTPSDVNSSAVTVLVARYVAALMVGVAVSYAPRELALDFLSNEGRKYWGPLIHKAFSDNGGPLMTAFVEQIRARRAVSSATGDMPPNLLSKKPSSGESDETLWRKASPQPIRVLGLDVGGTAIKAKLYRVDAEVPYWHLELKPDPVPLDSNEKFLSGKLPDVVGFLQVLRSKVSIPEGLHVDALGISFAAPVMDGVPVGRSGVSARFLPPVPDESNILPESRDGGTILEAHERNLHQIDFAAGAAKVFGAQCRTVVMNDGDADIRSSPELPGGGSGITVTIKEGNGVAFALWADGALVDILGETAKAILNINGGFDESKDDAHRFQREELSKRCSRNKFDTLLKERDKEGLLRGLLGGPDDQDDQMDRTGWTIGALLEAALGAVTPVDKDRGEAVLDFIRRSEAVAPAKLREAAGEKLEEILNALEGMTPGAPDDSALYDLALAEVHTRAKRDLSGAIADARDPGGTEARDRIANLSSQMSFRMEYGCLSGPEKAAIRCADILGRWLADAIALVWELYGPNEIRLAGGPLSGKTGIFIALSACEALKDAYAFDVVLDSPSPAPAPPTAPIREGFAAVHGPREIRKLVLLFPPEDSGEGGPKGAASAAFSRYLADIKMRQLQACRSVIASREIGADNKLFTVQKVIEHTKTKPNVESPWLVTPDDVGEMLTLESAALRLTRQLDGSFMVL